MDDVVEMLRVIRRADRNGEVRLREKDREFLSTVDRYVRERRNLSDKQDEWLYDLWKKAINHG